MISLPFHVFCIIASKNVFTFAKNFLTQRRRRDAETQSSNQLPTGVNRPAIDDLCSSQHVVIRMLRGCQTGMVSEYSHASPNF